MSGPYVIQYSRSRQYWQEPPEGAATGTWTVFRAEATQYRTVADADRAAAAVRAKFQRHNRDGIKVLSLAPDAAPRTRTPRPPSTEPDLFAGTH